jgi:DNA-binding transcriptional LysR family regulator
VETVDPFAGLQSFVRVVEAGGFSSAATRLGVAKSTVSKHVRELEDRLGVRLLERTTRTVQLTDAGARFFERAAALVADAEEAERSLGDLATEVRGRLRLSAPKSWGQRYLASLLAELLDAHAGLEIDLELSDRYVDLVDEGFDAAIRIGRPVDSSLVTRRLRSSRSLVVGAPAYFERHGRPEVPADLAHHHCLSYRYQQDGTRWRFEADGREQWVPVGGRFRANDGDVLRDLACQGAGLALLPDFIVDTDVAAGRLTVVLDGYCRSEAQLALVFPARRHVPARVRRLIDLVVTYFRSPAEGSPAAEGPPERGGLAGR